MKKQVKLVLSVKNKMYKKKILFLCTNNSSRSQIAEGLVNSILGTRYIAYSAGINPTKVNPYAIEVMKEIPDESIDLIVTDPPYLVNYQSRDGRAYQNDDPNNADWVTPAFAEM